jgi:hypothetical protein
MNDLQYLTDGKRHLICLPYSLENLHNMADKLNIKRCWFHRDHYDIPKRRKGEIERLCRIISAREIFCIIKENRNALP